MTAVPSRRPTYYIYEMTRLQPDNLSLGVPLRDGAVQIDGHSHASDTRLSVDIEPETVRVAREDGEALQIERNVRSEAGAIIERRKILERPVAELVFRRTGEDCIWAIDGDPAVSQPFDLVKFAGLLAGYAKNKQRKTSRISGFIEKKLSR